MHKLLYRALSDERIMLRYAQGDVAAFEHLYSKHKTRIYQYLRRQCGSSETAEELSHDTWMAVIRTASNYSIQAKFSSWIFRIAHNRLADYWRKTNRAHILLFDDLQQQIDDQSAEAWQLYAAQEILDDLKNLPAPQIEAILLKIEGFTHAEIAEITQAKPETVKSRLRYATQRLRTAAEV